MKQSLETTIALLQRTPAALDALLRGLPKEWTGRNEGEETWNALEIVGHLAHAEGADWMPRVRCILEFGESKDFPPFDRTGFWRIIEGREMEGVLDEFARLRSESLHELEGLGLQREDMDRTGRHPAFGTV